MLADKLVSTFHTQSFSGLYLNVIRPAKLTGSEKLPILFVCVSIGIAGVTVTDSAPYFQWIYGGGFTGGSNAM